MFLLFINGSSVVPLIVAFFTFNIPLFVIVLLEFSNPFSSALSVIVNVPLLVKEFVNVGLYPSKSNTIVAPSLTVIGYCAGKSLTAYIVYPETDDVLILSCKL